MSVTGVPGRRILVVVAVVAAAVAARSGYAAATGGAIGTTLSGPALPTAIVDDFEHLAAADGDPAPRDLRAVRAPYGAITTALGWRAPESGADDEAYLIVGHGRFTAFGAKVPSGAGVPHGRVLWAVFDRAGSMTDWGLRPVAEVALDRLGRVSVIAAPRASSP